MILVALNIEGWDIIIYCFFLHSWLNYSAVTVSIFGCAAGFGRYFNKNRGFVSVSVFIVPGFNRVQSKH